MRHCVGQKRSCVWRWRVLNSRKLLIRTIFSSEPSRSSLEGSSAILEVSDHPKIFAGDPGLIWFLHCFWLKNGLIFFYLFPLASCYNKFKVRNVVVVWSSPFWFFAHNYKQYQLLSFSLFPIFLFFNPWDWFLWIIISTSSLSLIVGPGHTTFTG